MIINQLLMYLKNSLTPQPALTSFPMHILFLIFMGLISLVSAQGFLAYYVYITLESLDICAPNCGALATAGIMLLESVLFFLITKCYVTKLATDNFVYHSYEHVRNIGEAFLRGFNK